MNTDTNNPVTNLVHLHTYSKMTFEIISEMNLQHNYEMVNIEIIDLESLEMRYVTPNIVENYSLNWSI